jgi:hypothetical protein
MVRKSALGQSTVNTFWAIGLGFHFHSLFSVSECWAIGEYILGYWAGISFPLTFLSE